jgi:hypothetical protein
MEPYDGINAYVFVSDAHDADIERLRGVNSTGSTGIRAVGILNGPYDAIVAVSAGSLDELRRIVMADVRGGQSPATSTAVALRPFTFAIPMSPDLPPVVAFVRALVERGRGRAVLEGASALPGFVGATLVAGDFDALIEFGGDSVDDVGGVLLERLHEIDGLVSSVTSFAAEVIQIA